jgi:hypothetical protein
MKRSILIILLISFLYILSEDQSEAQLWRLKRYEAVVGFGPSVFFGDIGGYSHGDNILGLKDMSFLQTRFDLNLSLKYRLNQNFNARLSLTSGFLRATDARGSNEGRGFEAFITIFEPALIGEWYFIKNRAENSYLFIKGRGYGLRGFFQSLDFYAFAGIGGLSYSVRGNDALEAHGYDTGGFTGVIPGGLGSTLIYSPNINFGVELGARYAFSDYLDGYTSQYSSSNDVYYFLNFTFTYKLKTGPKGLPSLR